VERAGYAAAPPGGTRLAGLGAVVVRAERLGGQADRARSPLAPCGTSLYWTGLSQGKRAVEVDFRSAEGREVIAALVARRGIVVANADLPGLSYEKLRERREDLIHALLTGRRDGGTAVDYTVNAETGLPAVTGPAGIEGPVNHVLPAW